MANDYNKLLKLLQLIDDSGFSNDLILVGSWNEYFYGQIYKDYKGFLSTLDVDFYCLNRIKIKTDTNLASILIKDGYTFNQDSLTNKTVFFNEDFEIEFLSKITREMSCTVKIPRLDVVAECLGGLEMIEKYILPYYDETFDFHVNLVKPSCYCVHKIIINNQRKENKKEKDRLAIMNVLDLISEYPDLREEFKQIVDGLSKKQRKAFNSNVAAIGIDESVENMIG